MSRAAWGTAWRIADGLFLALFALSVVVQVNDPDPTAWMAVYGAAAFAAALALGGRRTVKVPTAVAVVSLLWATTLSPRVVGHVPFFSMFGAWEMRDVGIEESREMYGLLIVAAWMSMLAIRARRARRAPPPVTDSTLGP